jgi:predicted nuclease of predicted toxin-antitoxin system
MLILLDQGTPVPLRGFLQGHTVKTAAQQGWSTLSNGDLLRAAEAEGFDVLLTTDKNFASQQDLRDRKIAVVVLGNPQWPVARPYVQSIVAAVNAASPGSYVVVKIPGGEPRSIKRGGA